MTATSGKVFKVVLEESPVLVRSGERRALLAREEADRLLSEAEEASERLRRSAVQAAERERHGARLEAQRIAREAEMQREAVFSAAREEAREQARAEVMAEFRPRIEEAVSAFETVVRDAERAFNECLEHHKGEIVGLALGIARKVVRRVSEEDAALVVRTAEAAIRLARDRSSLALRIHPSDIAILREFEEDLLARFGSLERLKIETDERIARGGVWIETPSGFVDARIETQIEEIIRAVAPDVRGGEIG
ncbi:MAG: hypothetical protein HUU16_04780 [Candidatus Omnitrophica bacterium]|nr:hypothetical protein [bacterium]NUN95466.1 hypothetical protein [Candidatus Omnitrophota bacterium]